jgi:predicted enzyme related to lactoylglutathione lyase
VIGRLHEVVVDCHDPARLARFWQQVLGGRLEPHGLVWTGLRLPQPGGGYLGFQRVPEAKTVKNRLHLDVEVDDLEAAAVVCVGLGARLIGEPQVDELGTFIVLADPEGNEFCLVKVSAAGAGS